MDHAPNIEKALLAQLENLDSPLIRRVTNFNQLLLHNYQVATIKNCRCFLAGCEQTFDLTLVPNQIIYPKYCADHRSPYRREYHVQRQESPLAPIAASTESAKMISLR